MGNDSAWNAWPDSVAESQSEPLEMWNKALSPILEYYIFQ